MNLFVPAPLPDEVAQGHVGRIALLNPAIPALVFDRVIRQAATEIRPDLGAVSQLEVVATLLDMSVESYARHHTLLPFTWCFQPTNQSPLASTLKIPLMIGARASSKIGRRSFLCQQCAQEDLAFWGFSYWRRTHQLPGVDRCIKHGSHLSTVSSIRHGAELPHELVEEARVVEEIPHSHQRRAVDRYSELVVTMLEGWGAYPIDHAIARLRKRRDAVGERSLEWLAGQQFPRDWLAANVPVLSRYAFSLALQYGGSAAIAVAMVLLYKTNDAALRDLSFDASEQAASSAGLSLRQGFY